MFAGNMSSLIFAAIVTILISFYFIYKKSFSYWKERNILHDIPWPIIGTHGYKIFGLRNNAEISAIIYKKYPNEKFVGYYRGTTPELYVKDPEYFKNILVSDFDHFYIRAVERDETNEERMMLNLFNCSGDYWRLLRHRLTPAFTTYKLTKMFPLIIACTEKLQVAAGEAVASGGIVDAFDLMSRYAMECICSTGFGLDTDIINERNSQFMKLGQKIFLRKEWQTRIIAIGEAVPSIRSMVNTFHIDPRVKKAIVDLVSDVREKRNFKPSGRNDFIDLLMELEALGVMKGESFEKTNADGTPIEIELEMDIVVFAAQVYIFFAGGFSTSAVAASTTLHFLAFNPDVQKRVQKHIDEIFVRYDNKISYDSICDMGLLEMALQESMRLFPPTGPPARICTKQYTFPGTDITIDPGVRVVIPTQAVYLDEKYFDNPMEYRPERFKTEEVNKRHKFTYIPFLEGQRKCIGARLGTTQSMAGVAAILQKFNVVPAPTSRQELKVNRNIHHVQIVDGGLPLRLVPRTSHEIEML